MFMNILFFFSEKTFVRITKKLPLDSILTVVNTLEVIYIFLSNIWVIILRIFGALLETRVAFVASSKALAFR